GKKFPNLLFPIEIKNINMAKHGSDSGSYDINGRFVPSKFEEIFLNYARTNSDALTSCEVDEYLKGNREAKDYGGWIGSLAEWKILYYLAKDKNGFLQRDTVRVVANDFEASIAFIAFLAICSKNSRGYSTYENRYTLEAFCKPIKVIVNGDVPEAIASVSGGAEAAIPPKTTEQKIARRNELKAKSTLLLVILDEHSLKFHGIKNAKTLWEAIKIRFGGNKESKKMQKTIMKRQYKNFAASRSEGFDKTYDRFQKLISQLEIHGEVISQEDANLKLLRSLPSAWNTHTLIMRNKSDLDTLSMNDLYNKLKVYEAEVKSQSSSSLNSHNVAFVSSNNTSSTNEAVNTAHDVFAASLQGQAFASTYADDVMFPSLLINLIVHSWTMKIWSRLIPMILKRKISNCRWSSLLIVT
nr:probable peroxygenase 4 [Tanacetum cinerariifolium]